jgi:hypothetical protein
MRTLLLQATCFQHINKNTPGVYVPMPTIHLKSYFIFSAPNPVGDAPSATYSAVQGRGMEMTKWRSGLKNEGG